MIKNEQLNNYINKPVWDNVLKQWRILKGYKRFGDRFYLTFTDTEYWQDANVEELDIYENEVKDTVQEPTTDTDEGKKDEQ